MQHEAFGMNPDPNAKLENNDYQDSVLTQKKIDPEDAALIEKIDALEGRVTEEMRQHQSAAAIAEEEAVKLRMEALKEWQAVASQEAAADAAEKIARRAAWDRMSEKARDEYLRSIFEKASAKSGTTNQTRGHVLHEIHRAGLEFKDTFDFLDRNSEYYSRLFDPNSHGTEKLK